MASNPYTYGSLGERWVVETPTSKANLDIARTKNDANRWALAQLVTAPDTSPHTLANGVLATTQSNGDNSTKVATTAYVDANVPSYTPSSLVGAIPSSNTTGQNAKNIIAVDLDDPTQVWSYTEFVRACQSTSWVSSMSSGENLGTPPTHGYMWIANDGGSVKWWNRDTGALYMTLTGGTDNAIAAAAVDLTFLDGKIYVATTTALFVLDLLADTAWRYTTGGMAIYKGNIKDRNAGSAYTVVNSGFAIDHNQVNGVAAWRDPLQSEVDSLGRPYQYIFAAVEDAGSVWYPYAGEVVEGVFEGAWFDSYGTHNGDQDHVAVSSRGWCGFTYHDGTNYRFYIIPSSHFADPRGPNYPEWHANAWGQCDNESAAGYAVDLPWTNSAVFRKPAAMPINWAWPGQDSWLISSDEGLAWYHPNMSDKVEGTAGGIKYSAVIRYNEIETTPYMKGDVRGVWCLNVDDDDSSTNGNDLTTVGSPTYANGGPAGGYVTLDDAGKYFTKTSFSDGDFGTADITVGGWFYLTGAPTSWAPMFYCTHSTGTGLISTEIQTSGIVTYWNDDAGSAETTTTPAIVTGEWYYLVCIKTVGYCYVYLNGELADRATNSAATGSVNCDQLAIGNRSPGTADKAFPGYLGGLFMTAVAHTPDEIRAEYRRGIHRLTSDTDVNDTLPVADVINVSADPSGGGWGVVTTDKKLTIFDAFGVPVKSDTYAGTTETDVALKVLPGMDQPIYAMSGDDQIEFVGGDQRAIQ